MLPEGLTAGACRARYGFVQRRQPTRAPASCCDPCWGRILLRCDMRAPSQVLLFGYGRRRRRRLGPAAASSPVSAGAIGAPGSRCRRASCPLGAVPHTPQRGNPGSVQEESFACELWSTDIRQRLTGDCHFSEMPRVPPYPAQGGFEVSLRRHGRHQHTGRRVVRLQILLHDETAHRVTDNHRRGGQTAGHHTDVLDEVGDRTGTQRLVSRAVAMAAKADRQSAITLAAKKRRKFSSQHHAACQAPCTKSSGTGWDSLVHPLSITSSMSHTASCAPWARCKPPCVKVPPWNNRKISCVRGETHRFSSLLAEAPGFDARSLCWARSRQSSSASRKRRQPHATPPVTRCVRPRGLPASAISSGRPPHDAIEAAAREPSLVRKAFQG